MKLTNRCFVSNCINLQQIRSCHSTQKRPINEKFAANYCVNVVEKSDHENYLCTLLLNKRLRRHAFALRAFNAEVAKSSFKITEEQIAKMRLKFWYDAVDQCFANDPSYVPEHPVLNELRNTAVSNMLTKLYLKRLVTARDRPANQAFLSIKEMEDYAEQSFSSLYYLLVELTGVNDIHVDHAISHLGKAQGIVTLLRANPYKERSQATNIPQEILIKHGVSQERVVRDKIADKGVEECVFEVATVAHQHLKKSRSLAYRVPKPLKVLFLPAVAVERYLERLRLANFRLTSQSCLQTDAMLPMAIYWHNIRNKY